MCFGVNWCSMVHKRTKKAVVTRFTVTLTTADHDRLKDLGARATPPLPLNYMVQLAVTKYLERVNDTDRVTVEVGAGGDRS